MCNKGGGSLSLAMPTGHEQIKARLEQLDDVQTSSQALNFQHAQEVGLFYLSSSDCRIVEDTESLCEESHNF